jgi:predicted patatin/cPLA2 family phospholipase
VSVFDLIAARRARRATPPFGDQASLALVVEGGGMRGVVSAGMLWGLEDLACGRVFDAVYGSSAGAINAAYFLGGQAGLATSIYYEDINNRTFIDFRRALWGRPILDLTYLLSEVAVRQKPLAAERVIASPSPLSIIATDVETGRRALLSRFEDAADLRAALRASATMPIVAGGPFTYRGRQYLDASISEPIALPSAEQAGHTHVLVLLTRTGPERQRPSAFDRYFIGPRLRRISPTLADAYLRRSEPYRVVMQAVRARRGISSSASVAAIQTDGQQIGRLERRGPVLAAGARRGYQAVVRALGQPGS